MRYKVHSSPMPVILAALLSVLFSCAVMAQNPPVYENEPNDTPADANTILTTQRVQGFLQDGNPDWFSFEIPEAAPGDESPVFGIRLAAPRETDPLLVLLRDGNPVVTSDTPGDGAAERVRWLRLIPGSYLLQVSGKGTNIKEPYILELFREKSAPENLEQEPNNQIKWANRLEDQKPLSGFLTHGDMDYLRIEGTTLESMVEISIAGASLESGSPWDHLVGLTLVNGRGEVIKDFGSQDISQGIRTSFRTTGEDIFLKLTGASSGPFPYEVRRRRSLRDKGVEAEVNDVTNMANTIICASPIRGRLYPQDDIDWFSFRTESQESRAYSLSARSLSGALSIRVVDVQRGAEKTQTLASGTSLEVPFEGQGDSDFLIMISRGVNDSAKSQVAGAGLTSEASAAAIPGYEISVSDRGPAAQDSEGEINDQITAPRGLQGNGSVQGTLTGGDRDFFKLSTPGGNVFDLRIILELHGSPGVLHGPSRLTFLTAQGLVIGSRTFYLNQSVLPGVTAEVSLQEMKFFNLMDESYLMKLEGFENTGYISYRLTAKTWEIQDPGKDPLFQYEYPFHAPEGGFSALVLSSRQVKTGRYRIYFHHPPSGRLRFIEEGVIPREGLLWRLNRFRMEGYYLIVSEVPLEAMGITRDPDSSLLISQEDQAEATPSFGAFTQLMQSLGVRFSRVTRERAKILNAASGKGSGFVISPQDQEIFLKLSNQTLDKPLRSLALSLAGSVTGEFSNPNGVTMEIGLRQALLPEAGSEIAEQTGSVPPEGSSAPMVLAPGATLRQLLPQGRWILEAGEKGEPWIQRLILGPGTLVEFIDTGQASLEVRAEKGSFFTIESWESGDSEGAER